MNTFEIAIKTYQRADVLKSKTLSLLERHGIGTERVTLFLADENERKIYKNALNSFRGDMQIQQESGIRGVVRCYRKHYKAGTFVLHCDDDIIELNVATSKEGGMKPLQGLHEYAVSMFDLTQRMRCAMWSIYAVNNAFFMRDAIVAGLKFCSGCFHGFISDAGVDTSLLPQVNYKDDVEASVLYFIKHGAVLRDERVVAKTHYFKRGGGGTAGASHTNREALHLKDVEDLAERFPQYCIKVKKKSFGGADIRMNTRIRSTKLGNSFARF